MFDLDLTLDSKLRPQIRLARELMVFPRTILSGKIEYRAVLGFVDDLPAGWDYGDELNWKLALEYILAKSFH